MKNKDKAEFDSLLIGLRDHAHKIFSKITGLDAEDMAQEVAVRLAAARIPLTSAEGWRDRLKAEFKRVAGEVWSEEVSRRNGLKLMDLESATRVPDVATPDSFLMAQEIAGDAIRFDLDAIMMGDSVIEEAKHFGYSRQYANRVINERRAAMAHFLET